MKWFVCLFSFYVLFLSGVPCAAAGDCCMDEVSTSQSPQKDGQEQQHKPICPCSPFFACGACHGVVVPKFEIQFSRVVMPEKKLHFIYAENELFDFPPAIWQPPRIG